MINRYGDGAATEAAMRQSEKFAGTPEHYDVAKKVLWAEWKAGQELRDSERGQGQRHDLTLSQPETKSGFYALIDSHGLDKNTAYRWITISFGSCRTAPIPGRISRAPQVPSFRLLQSLLLVPIIKKSTHHKKEQKQKPLVFLTKL